MKKKDVRNTVALVIMFITIVILVIALVVGHKKAPVVNEAANKPVVIDSNATSKDEQELEAKLASRNIYFAGIDNATITTESRIKLENLPENEDFLMKYTVTNEATGEKVYETDLIPSGQFVNWIAGDTLGKGEYDLSFLMTPYVLLDDGTYKTLTSGNNTVHIVIQ